MERVFHGGEGIRGGGVSAMVGWQGVGGVRGLSEDVQDTSPGPEIVRLFQEIAILNSI